MILWCIYIITWLLPGAFTLVFHNQVRQIEKINYLKTLTDYTLERLIAGLISEWLILHSLCTLSAL